MQEMMFMEHGINWADYDQAKKNGRLIVKVEAEHEITAHDGDGMERSQIVKRNKWVSKPAWKFTEDKDRLLNMIPKYE